MRLYKLTDAHGRTRNETQWGEGVTHEAAHAGTALCTASVIHAYRDPLLAVLMNPVHAGFEQPQLWEAEGDVVADDGAKVGCKSLTTTRRTELPEISTEQRVRFAVLAAKEVYADEAFVEWADSWLSGEDRSAAAAAAAEARSTAARLAAAARAASRAAAWAARAEAARAAVWAARAAAVAKAAAVAAAMTIEIDFIAIAREAVS